MFSLLCCSLPFDLEFVAVYNQQNFHIFKYKMHFYEEKCIYLPYENTWVSLARRSVAITCTIHRI